MKVDYVTPIGQAQKAVQVEGIARVIEGEERLSAVHCKITSFPVAVTIATILFWWLK